MSEGEGQTKPRKKVTASRRLFLQATGAGALIGIGAGTVIGRVVTNQIFENAPQPLPNDELLKATLQAVEQKGGQSSFVPEGRFTNEVFEQVRKSTYVVECLTDNNSIVSGTGWCAFKENDEVYIVTNRHVADLSFLDQNKDHRYGTRILNVNIWRPNIDNSKVSPLKITIATSDDKDLAVIKCKLKAEEAQRVNPLIFRDREDIKEGDKLLVAGFPEEFRQSAKDNLSYVISGEVVSAEKDKDKPNDWYAQAVESYGDSGSPAAVVDDKGRVSVVGIIYAGNRYVFQKNLIQMDKRPVLIGSNLSIVSLIEKAHNAQ